MAFAMHAACYAHALVPGALDEANDALEARSRGEAVDVFEELAQAASMVRSNAHADDDGTYASTLVDLALRAPEPRTPKERAAAVELFETVLALDAADDDARRARLEARRDAAGDASPDPSSMSVGELKALITRAGLSSAGIVEKDELRRLARDAVAVLEGSGT